MKVVCHKILLVKIVVIFALLSLLGCSALTGKRVTVNSMPSGAGVFEDDSAVGVTPWTGLVSSGSHKMTFEKVGYPHYDTTLNFDPYHLHSAVGPLLYLGGFGISLGGSAIPCVALIEAGLGTALGGGLLYIFTTKNQLDAELNREGSEATKEPEMHFVGLERFQFNRNEKLFRADSVCFDASRRALWLHDAVNDVRRPVMMSSAQRCDPKLGLEPSWRLFLKLWGGSTVGILGVIGVSDLERPALKSSDLGSVAAVSVLGGAALGFYLWTKTQNQERCEQVLDSSVVRTWAQQFPCFSEMSTVPEAPAEVHVVPLKVNASSTVDLQATEQPPMDSSTREPATPATDTTSLPAGIHVIQLPNPQ